MRKSVLCILLMAFLIAGCGEKEYPREPGILSNAVEPVNTPTYEESGQATHPSILYFEKAWHGYAYWMAMTPYPYNDETFENPSILASDDGETWEVPDGATNPLVDAPKVGHNCDVDLIYDPDLDELRMYYVEADDETGSVIYLLTSDDGATWKRPRAVFRDHSVMYGILSPTVICNEDGTYQMWYVDSGNEGWKSQSNVVKTCMSRDGIQWDEPTVCDDFVLEGYQIWHLFIRYIPEEDAYLALFPAYKNGTDADHCYLFAAKKTGDRPWMFEKKPLLSPGEKDSWDDLCIYRSTFLYHKDELEIWYSARKRDDSSWRIGKISVARDLLRDLIFNEED